MWNGIVRKCFLEELGSKALRGLGQAEGGCWGWGEGKAQRQRLDGWMGSRRESRLGKVEPGWRWPEKADGRGNGEPCRLPEK